ncbi:MAG: transcription initiation factor TFIID subunit 11 [Paramarteilia canceri]
MMFFVSQLSEDQLNQYETFRRSTFPKSLIKKHIIHTTGCKNVSQNVLFSLSGVTKVLVGQIVDEALELSSLSNDTLPLKPKYIRYAFSNLLFRGDIAELKGVRDFTPSI